jgi:hypothetical protein
MVFKKYIKIVAMVSLNSIFEMAALLNDESIK